MKTKEFADKLLKQDPILIEVVKRLVGEFHPDRIFLFGSRAEGRDREDSDYDFLVVVPELTALSHRLSVRAHEVLSGLGIAKDIFFTSKEKFELRKSIANTLAEIAVTDGAELYVA